ncbi:class I SAM-dependent methyltransferase [Streptomyces sp. NPDC090306]|uniref:class I SAM-dependent methyltransferase n=1 Tax=unclassified Streptomyces TaxID=2593676 RepID=UPI0036E9BE7B
MLDYEKEVDVYDTTRGGEPRAGAAARAVLGLVPDTARDLLDAGCGTGIVTRRMARDRPDLRITGADFTHRMARTADERLPGTIVVTDVRRLPFADRTFDAVTSVWLLHLMPGPDDVRAVAAECARVLRPGGVWVTTVDKAAAHNVGSDIDAALADRPPSPAWDAADAVVRHAGACGLVPAGAARFRGVGQGRSPSSTLADMQRGWFGKLPPGEAIAERYADRLRALPDQERRRADPRFSLRAFARPGNG